VSAGIFDVGRTNDITLSRLTTGQLKILQDSTHGVALDVATDGTAKLLSRAGADTAIFKTSVAIIPSTQSGVYKMYSVDGFSTLYSKISSAADGVIDFSESAGAKKVALTVPTGTGNTLAVLTAAPAESATKTGNFTAISYTPASTAGTYRVDGVITTTSSTNTGTVQLTVDFVDSQGTTHTADIIPLVDAAGVIATTKTGASKTYSAVSKMISINNAGTAIALKVVITGSVSYTVSGSIEKIQ
jgi:hypothetical protein